MSEQPTVAVIGAGVIGAAIACALAQEGRAVVLVDRAPLGEGGASFGNAGHIATELVEPLASFELLFGFWRELTMFGGVLNIPARRLIPFLPWAIRFARAAFRLRENTPHLASFVRPAVPALIELLESIGRPDLIRQHGHYEIWLGGNAAARSVAQAREMARLDVATRPAPDDIVQAARAAAGAHSAAGLHFPGCAHVRDPLEVVRALAGAARDRGATLLHRQVNAIRPLGDRVELVTDSGLITTDSAIVCCGVWSGPLLRPLGFKVPLEAARGYHVQMPGHAPLVDAPIVYSDQNIVVTPMAGRLRGTSFMEFAGADAPADPRKIAWLQTTLRKLGYTCDEGADSWVGPRPVLPDYLPAIGRIASAPNIFYAFGHQHIGLTLAAVTARVVADLVAERKPRHDISAFDLGRF